MNLITPNFFRYNLLFIYNTGNGEIVFCDVNGGMGAAIASGNERVQEEEEAEEMERADDMDDDNDFLNHDAADDDNDENVISIEKLKRTVLGEEDDDDFRSGKCIKLCRIM